MDRLTEEYLKFKSSILALNKEEIFERAFKIVFYNISSDFRGIRGCIAVSDPGRDGDLGLLIGRIPYKQRMVRPAGGLLCRTGLTCGLHGQSVKSRGFLYYHTHTFVDCIPDRIRKIHLIAFLGPKSFYGFSGWTGHFI